RGEVPVQHVHLRRDGGKRHDAGRREPNAAGVQPRRGGAGDDGRAEERLDADDLQREPPEPDDHRRHRGNGGAHAQLAGHGRRDGEQRARLPVQGQLHHQRGRRTLHRDARRAGEEVSQPRSDRAEVLPGRHPDGRDARLLDAEGRRRQQLHRRHRRRHLDGGPDVRQLPQPRPLETNKPQALHVAGLALAVRKVLSWRPPIASPRSGIWDGEVPFWSGRGLMVRKLLRFGLAGMFQVGISGAAPVVLADNPVTGAADKAAEDTSNAANSAGDTASDATKSAADKASESAKGAGEATEDDAKKGTDTTKDAAKQGADSSKDAAKKAGDKASDTYQDAKGAVRPAD